MNSPDGNLIDSLLHADDPTRTLLNGLVITAPKPNFSTDMIPPFNVLLSNIDIVNDGAVYNEYNVSPCDGPWAPAPVSDRVAQYGVVEKAWLAPSAGASAAQRAVDMWATLWAGLGQKVPVMVGGPPLGMLRANRGLFELDYLEAPMVSVASGEIG